MGVIFLEKKLYDSTKTLYELDNSIEVWFECDSYKYFIVNNEVHLMLLFNNDNFLRHVLNILDIYRNYKFNFYV